MITNTCYIFEHLTDRLINVVNLLAEVDRGCTGGYADSGLKN